MMMMMMMMLKMIMFQVTKRLFRLSSAISPTWPSLAPFWLLTPSFFSGETKFIQRTTSCVMIAFSFLLFIPLRKTGKNMTLCSFQWMPYSLPVPEVNEKIRPNCQRNGSLLRPPNLEVSLLAT